MEKKKGSDRATILPRTKNKRAVKKQCFCLNFEAKTFFDGPHFERLILSLRRIDKFLFYV